MREWRYRVFDRIIILVCNVYGYVADYDWLEGDNFVRCC